MTHGKSFFIFIVVVSCILLSMTNICPASYYATKPSDIIEKKQAINQIKYLNKNLNQQQLNEYSTLIILNSRKYQIPKELVISLIQRESSFREIQLGPKIKKKQTKSRCIGLMQVHPIVHKEKYERRNLDRMDLYIAEHNINIGCEILNDFLKQHKGNAKKALIGYVGGKQLNYVNDILQWTTELVIIKEKMLL